MKNRGDIERKIHSSTSKSSPDFPSAAVMAICVGAHEALSSVTIISKWTDVLFRRGPVGYKAGVRIRVTEL